MRHSLPARALLAAAALLAAGPAHALSSATATYSDFHIGLADLDPSDGLAPSLVLDPQSRSFVSVSDPADTNLVQQGESAFGPVSMNADVGGTGGAGSFSGDPFGAGAVITSTAVGNDGDAIGRSFDGISGPQFGFAACVLGARSQVTFSGAASVAWDASNYDGFAYGMVALGLWQFIGGDLRDVGRDYLVASYPGQEGLTGLVSRPIEFVFANRSDAPVTLIFDLEVQTYAVDRTGYTLPVDEPTGAALLLVGAPMLLWRVRRRR